MLSKGVGPGKKPHQLPPTPSRNSSIVNGIGLLGVLGLLMLFWQVAGKTRHQSLPAGIITLPARIPE